MTRFCKQYRENYIVRQLGWSQIISFIVDTVKMVIQGSLHQALPMMICPLPNPSLGAHYSYGGHVPAIIV